MTNQDTDKAISRKKLNTTDPILVATWDGDEKTWVSFRFINNAARPRIISLGHLFSELRRALQTLTEDRSWSVRYASQVRQENFPFLHSAQELQILLDPLAPLRDPIRELLKDGYLCWQLFPSQSYYFKSLEDAEAIRERDRLIKNAVPTPSKPARREGLPEDPSIRGTSKSAFHSGKSHE